uniref:Uncharacterized protein n=1 Tax=Anguilla anguilla TaxID=7936 RepID=A0A0E9QYA4_ANGAN
MSPLVRLSRLFTQSQALSTDPNGGLK